VVRSPIGIMGWHQQRLSSTTPTERFLQRGKIRHDGDQDVLGPFPLGERRAGSNVQGGADVSLTQHSAVKGVREGSRLASAIECQAQNGTIELKQHRHDPASV